MKTVARTLLEAFAELWYKYCDEHSAQHMHKAKIVKFIEELAAPLGLRGKHHSAQELEDRLGKRC